MPWSVFGQVSQWDSAISAATRSYAQGNYSEAELRYIDAEKAAESFGPFDHRLAITANNLGELYLREAKFAEAEPLFKRPLDIWEKGGNPSSLVVATTLNNLAALYTYLRRFEEAETIYRKSLVLREQRLGPEHPEVAKSLESLAELLLAKSKQINVDVLYLRALAIKKKAYGPESPATVECLNNLAVVYSEEGKLSEAERTFNEAATLLSKQP